MSSGPCRELGGAGHDRRAAALGGEPARDLVAHLVDRRRRRADERHAHVGDRAGEVGVLGEEAVAGVDAVGAAVADRVEDGVGVEVALGRGLPAERERLVGEPDVQRVAIELGVDRDGLDAELASGADDAHGDLAAVGDQDLLQHGCQCRCHDCSRPHAAATSRGPPDGPSATSSETGSTNADLLAAAATGAPDRTVLVADHQTAGRGRLDRRWDAPPGVNLLVSILFRTVPIPASALTQRVGLAAIDACLVAAGVEAVLKWPNDLLARRSQAGRDPGPAGGRRFDRGGARAERRLGARGRGVVARRQRRRREPTPLDLLAALLTAFDALPDDIGRPVPGGAGDRSDGASTCRCPVGGSTGGQSTSTATAAWSSSTRAGSRHRLDVGDVVHVRDAGPPA